MSDFPFRKLWHKDFGLDHAVQRMTMDERRRFLWACLMVAPEAEEPGCGTEEEWRDWLDYEVDEWPEHRRNMLRAMKVQDDGRWLQERVRREHEERERCRLAQASKGRRRQELAQQNSAGAEPRLSHGYKTESEIETKEESKSTAPAAPGVVSISSRDGFKEVVRGLAAAKEIPPPKKRNVDPEEVWSRLSSEPDTVQRTAMKLAGWLEKKAVSRADVLSCVDHYLAHQATVDNVFTYYAPKSNGFHFATTASRLRSQQDEHERMKREERQWLDNR